MKVRMIGAGAVGAAIASQLMGSCDFGLIVDEERFERYSKNPLTVDGVSYDFPLYTEKNASKADLVIFATKNFHLDNAIKTATPFIGENTAILSLLNGIDSEEVLSSVFGAEKVLYAMIRISSLHSGNIIKPMNKGEIVFGEKNNERSERVNQIASLFDKAGVKYIIPTDIRHEIWWKFMINCCFNSISSVLDSTFHEMYENFALHNAGRMVLKEVQAVAKAEGVCLTDKDIDDVFAKMNNTNGKTSLLQDVLAGRETENSFFCGSVVALGKKHGLNTPYSEFLYNLVEASSFVRKLRIKEGK